MGRSSAKWYPSRKPKKNKRARVIKEYYQKLKKDKIASIMNDHSYTDNKIESSAEHENKQNKKPSKKPMEITEIKVEPLDEYNLKQPSIRIETNITMEDEFCTIIVGQ